MAAERKITTRIEMKGDKEYRRKMREVNQEMKTFGSWTDVMAGGLAAGAIQKGLSMITDWFKKSWEASVEFETAMAGVAKTTDLSAVQLEQMGEKIKLLSTQIPMTAVEIAGLVEAAGQLGIADKNVLQFAEVMAALGVSTNLSANEAATALAQMANVMGTAAQEYERMGSSIVALGNSSATTEADIVALAQRLAGSGKLVGMSEAQLFGYAAALSSVGIEAEAGGSALSKVWSEIETMVATKSDDLSDFAAVAGVSATEFSRAWSEDAAGAFQLFLAGLADTERTGGSAIATLAELGITEIRTSRALTSLAGAGDLLNRSLETSESAWDANTALSTEAGIRYETTASRIAMAENALNNLNIAVGDKFKPLVTSVITGGAEMAGTIATALAGQKLLPEMVGDANAAYQQQADAVELVASQAYTLVDRLEELGNVENLTGQQRQEYLATLQLLKDIMPAAAGAIDLETGAVEGGTAALRENIAASKENALADADLTARRNRYDALAIAQENLANKRALYTLAINDATLAEAEWNRVLAEQEQIRADITRQLGEQMGDASLVTPEMVDEALRASDAWERLNGEQETAAARLYETQQAADSLNAAITEEAAQVEEGQRYAEEYADTLEQVGQKMEDAAESSGAVTEAAQQQIDDFQAMSDRLTELQDQLLTATDEARKQVAGVVSGFGEIEMPEAVSMDTTLKNLQSQLDYMETYKTNLKKAQELGLDQTIVEQLSDGSTESAAILAGIVEDGGTNIDALNAKLAEVSIGKEAMATAMAEAAMDFTDKADAIVTATNEMVANFNQEGAAKSGAAATIQAVIDGMNGKLGTLRAKSNEIRRLMNFSGSGGGSGGQGSYVPPHAAGLAYVPADGYIAQLHRGEMVLTALEARAYRAEQFANYGMLAALSGGGDTYNSTADNRRVTTRNGDTYNIAANVTAPENMDARALVKNISNLGKRRARGRGKILA